MTRTITANSLTTAAAVIAALLLISPARSEDMASFATGGYAKGLQTMAMMHMIDANKDGMVSMDEWTAFQERSFVALDRDHSGFLERPEFTSAPKEGFAFATAAYVHGLMSDAMFKKIDADGDGKISKEEFLSYQRKIFEMLDKSGKGMVGPTDFIRRGS
ncbi:MAG TPA: EF-hand domain-containing protein [Steroidobacteraceae bacterium]|jgi:Ca2+-binding EF-hand superfamily protein|nr:EF-hand domain-containing protein [Steroidobacteraceae bacterium]